MTIGTSTRYALHAVVDLARADDSSLVSVASIAHRRGIPETALAKVFQRLVRSKLVVGTRGPHGGYRLARPPNEITVLDVLSVFERPAGEVGGEDSLAEFFGMVDGQARSAFASVTIDRLAARDTTPL